MAQSRTSKVFALSLGQGLNTIVGLGLAMITARVLSKTDLATYRQTRLAYEVVLPLLGLGMGQAIYYFLPVARKRLRGIVVDAVVLLAGIGTLCAIFIIAGGNHLLAKRFSNPAIVHTLLYIAPLPIIALPAAIIPAVLVVRERVNLLSAYNVLKHLAIGVSVLVTCYLWRQPEQMVITYVAVTCAAGAVGLWFAFRSVPADSWYPDPTNMATMVRFSTPLALATMVGTISLQLDKLIVSAMQPPEIFAVYSNGAREIPLIGIVTGSIAGVILPDLRKAVAEGENEKAVALFRKAAEKSAWLLLPAMMFFMVSADSFIVTLFSEKYAASSLPFRIYLLLLPARIAFAGPILVAIGKTRSILFRSCITLFINAGLSIYFVSVLGYVGAALGSVVSIYFFARPYNILVITRSLSATLNEILPLTQCIKIIAIFLIPTALSLLVKMTTSSSNHLLYLFAYLVIFFPFSAFFWTRHVFIVPSITSLINTLRGH